MVMKLSDGQAAGRPPAVGVEDCGGGVAGGDCDCGRAKQLSSAEYDLMSSDMTGPASAHSQVG